VPELTDADGTPLRAGTGQPLFHVEHSVGGTELQPMNRWRIVHHTDAVSDRLIERLQHMASNPWLAEHRDLHPPQPRHRAHQKSPLAAGAEAFPSAGNPLHCMTGGHGMVWYRRLGAPGIEMVSSGSTVRLHSNAGFQTAGASDLRRVRAQPRSRQPHPGACS